ncbi:MAG: AsmA family protein [Bacteroidetes bacterium]|nr:AsmA family protein [Bacteroidota bacterium]
MKTILKIAGVTLAALLLLAVLLPYIFRDRIGQLVKDEINKSVNARVDYGRVSASFFRHFPAFTLTINDLDISGLGEFDSIPLFNASKLSVTINLRSLIAGSPYKVERISLDRAGIHLLVNAEGKANWDIALPDTTEQTVELADEGESISLKLKKITVNRSELSYVDHELSFSTRLTGLKGNLSGDMSLDRTLLNLDLSSDNLVMSYEGMTLLDKVTAVFTGKIDAELARDMYTIRSEVLKLNEMNLDFAGSFDLSGENIGMDFVAEARDADFRQLLSIVPAIYTNEFKDLKASGRFSLKAGMKGEYGEKVFPAYFAHLEVENGGFAYPSLPSSLERFFLQLRVDNPDGVDDHLALDIDRFSATINGQSVEGRLSLRQPFTDPLFKASLDGVVDFETITGLLPAGTLPEAKGRLNAAFSAAAKMSDITARRYAQVEASGQLSLKDFSLKEAQPGMDLTLASATATLRPEASRIEIKGLQLGKSDFELTGEASDYLPYLLADGVLNGNLSIRSKLLDANELMQAFMKADTIAQAGDTTAMKLELPERLNLGFDARIGQLLYENFELSEVNAGLRYVNKTLTFSPLNARMLGGTIQMQGSFDGKIPDQPMVDFSFALNDFDIPSAYQTLGLFSRAAPIAERTKGRFSTSFRMKGMLDQNLQPVFSTLQGGGGLQSSRITIESVNLLNMLADRLGNEELRRIVSDGVNLSFEFINGRVFQKPFTFRYTDMEATLAGSIGFDQTLDYDLALSVPFEKLGAEVNRQLQQLSAQAAGRGINLSAGNRINVRAKIGGTATAPTLSLDYRDYASNLRNELMQAASAELEKQKEQLRMQAREEADKIIEQARRQAEEIMQQAEAAASRIRTEAAEAAARVRREADSQAEKLINEAKGKGMLAERAAQEAARKLRQQAASSAQRIEQEADRQAGNVVQEARRQSDKLLDDARARAAQL